MAARKASQLKYLNDPDPWMLGEDIPDMDFFFSQVWLTCFVNEFEKPSGRAYKKILSIYRGYHLWFYYGKRDSNEVGETIVKKFLRTPAFAARVNREIVKWSDRLRAYAEKIPETGLDALSEKRLWSICERHDKLHTQYYQWGWIPVAADMFHSNLTEAFKRYMLELNVPEEKRNEYFVILTQPNKKSLIQIQREEFLRIAGIIMSDSYHRRICQELFRKFQEQQVAQLGYKTHTKEYEEALGKKVSDLISRIKPAILAAIQRHYAKYFYVNRMWVGQPSTFEYFLKELVKLIGVNTNVKAMLAQEIREFQANIKKRRVFIKKLKIMGKWRTLFDAFGDFMVTKIYRRYAQLYALYKMEFVHKEIGSRLGLTLMQVKFMLPQEIHDALLDGKLNRREISERTKFCVYYVEKGRGIIFTGKKAEALAKDTEKKVKVAEVSELKGQTGCVGHAKGIVKIVIRPADMAKMKQGDILVSIATDPDIVPAMKKAAAIVTEQGGVTSHAAIVSRELGIPCIIGTKIATRVLKDGDLVEVNANHGWVRKIKS